MATSTDRRRRRRDGAAGALLLALVLAACSAPFGLDQPTTRSLEDGVASALSSARSLEIKGGYEEASVAWKLDLQLQRGGVEHVTLDAGGAGLEAILVGGDAYFRGRQFLAAHVATGARSRQLVEAAGDSWWKGLPAELPKLPEFTDGGAFRAAFLGSALNRRADGASAAGTAAVELSGPRADVWVQAAPPHHPLRVRLRPGVTVDGLQAVDFSYGEFDQVPAIGRPAGVVDFANAATLPPLYSVVAVDTSGCADPCIVAARLQNLGGLQPAAGPSLVTFQASDAVSGARLGSCAVKVIPDVPFTQTTTVRCTMAGPGGLDLNGAVVKATVANPGRG